MFKNVKISLLALAFFLGGCAAQNAEILTAHPLLPYLPSENVASIVPSEKQVILFLSVEDNRKNVQSDQYLPGLFLETTLTPSISNALKTELNLLGI